MTSKIKVDNIADQDDNNIINESGDVITVGAAGDTVAVAGNIVKSNAYQASDAGNIISQSGTTITLGASGDTITLASGASQTGFGRTGTVDWQTSIKTSGFTAVSGEGYFCNTTSGAFTVTLPASPSAGDIVSVKDYANTFDSNNLTIGRNSSNIGGAAIDAVLSAEGTSVTLIYADATKGWLVTQEGAQSDAPQPVFTVATGGNTVNTVGDFKYHVFTGPGTFCVSQIGNSSSIPTGGPANICFMVVAGGGAGQCASGGGAGGAGGIRQGACQPITVQGYPVTVGAGSGCNGSTGNAAGNGSNSVFYSTTSAGGGGGGAGWTGSGNAPGSEQGQNGGSGGGGGARYSVGGGSGASPGGLGNTPPVSPPQGAGGGNGNSNNSLPTMSAGGGGGGGPGCGASGTNSAGGAGGTGRDMKPIFGPSQPWYAPGADAGVYAGGGGGKTFHCIPGGAGGQGGGGDGGNGPTPGSNGIANTGGGGGGGGHSGGSGIVVIKYKFQ